MQLSNNQQAFLALVRAGLWEKEANLSQVGTIDYKDIYRLAEEQSIVGLVAAGLEHVSDNKVPQEIALSFVGRSLQLEQRNLAMNIFVGELIDKLSAKDIYLLLVKGQGIAQCYERPLWRSCGDIDLLLSDNNYRRAKDLLMQMSSFSEPEGLYEKHLGFHINSWSVEIHGTLRCGLSRKMDEGIDEVQNKVFCEGTVRSWMDGRVQVFLPGETCDAVFIFTHFLKHYYKGGLGLRQICDWCRLLWTYRSSINRGLLDNWIRKMGLISEWKAFGAFAVEYLGMPKEAIPLYDNSECWKRKAARICTFVISVGNFGNNRDKSYFNKYPYLIRKTISMNRRLKDLYTHARVFPLDSIRFLPSILFYGLKSATKGE